MRTRRVDIQLPEGLFKNVEVLEMEESDRPSLRKIYSTWRNLSKQLLRIGGRAINLPEGLSENAFSLEMNTVRFTQSLSGVHSSFDCYSLIRKTRIQVKACSVLPDLTSFGPTSVWDEIYFVDFYKDGKWDGSFDIYQIQNRDIYNQKVNQTETLRDQQLAGKRPRFSIYKNIILAKNLKPIKTCSL